MMPTVEIVLSVHNGARFLPDQIRSLQAQTHGAWRLWIRDDGSTDDSYEVASRFAAEDPRVRVHARDGLRLGLPRCQGWLLERLPEDAGPVFGCDADDVWLPHKIERSLVALRGAEGEHPGAVLVHTDLEVVDAQLRSVAPSLWGLSGTAPEPASLARLLVANVATWPTLVMNRHLLDLASPVPPGAAEHDWWLALVAAAFGTVAAVHEPTMLYRRHGANVYSSLTGSLQGVSDALDRLAKAASTTPELRKWVRRTAVQAGALLDRFGDRLSVEQQEMLRDFASIPERGFFGRKLGVMRHHALAERGFVRNLGLVLRA